MLLMQGENKSHAVDAGFLTLRNSSEGRGAQSHKKQKLSGKQDFCRKNFPDKARKSH